jgi:hypothetical protein
VAKKLLAKANRFAVASKRAINPRADRHAKGKEAPMTMTKDLGSYLTGIDIVVDGGMKVS